MRGLRAGKSSSSMRVYCYQCHARPGSKPGSVVPVAGMGIVGERAAWHDCKRPKGARNYRVLSRSRGRYVVDGCHATLCSTDLGRPQSTGLAAQVLDLVVPIGR
jgi:hypothetical protein